MQEIWKDIEGYDGKYQISNFGKVRSFSKWKNGRLLKIRVGMYQYESVHLYNVNTKSSRTALIHRLVAMAFIPNMENKREVNHKDGNKLNNHIDNLEWATPSENMQHACDIGLQLPMRMAENPSAKKVNQYSLNGEFIRSWNCAIEASKTIGINYSGISKCCLGRAKTAGGFIWRYKDNDFEIKIDEVRKINKYDLHGNFIDCYLSAKEAVAKNSLSKNASSAIYACCNKNQKTAYGFIWMYSDDKIKLNPENHKRMTRGKKINKIDENGNIIAEYESANEAERKNLFKKGAHCIILECCKDIRKKAYGYKWKFKQ